VIGQILVYECFVGLISMHYWKSKIEDEDVAARVCGDKLTACHWKSTTQWDNNLINK